MRRSSEVWLSGLIVVLAVPPHLIGLVFPAIYRDPAILLPQNLGTDIVTLCVVIPMLALAAYTGFFVLLTVIGGVLAWRFTAAQRTPPSPR